MPCGLECFVFSMQTEIQAEDCSATPRAMAPWAPSASTGATCRSTPRGDAAAFDDGLVGGAFGERRGVTEQDGDAPEGHRAEVRPATRAEGAAADAVEGSPHVAHGTQRASRRYARSRTSWSVTAARYQSMFQRSRTPPERSP